MSSVVISGDTSGAITLSAPAVSGTNTITLPASTGTVLTTGSPQSGGVIQVIQATDSTSRSTSSSSWVTGSNTLSVSITPKFNTSKILILCSLAVSQTASNGGAYYTVYRNGSTNLGSTSTGFFSWYTNASYSNPFRGSGSISYLDSPATTSSTTYQVYMQTNTVGNAGLNNESQLSTITVMEIAA